MAEQLGIKLHFVDVVQEYKRVVLSPRHGYGANLNPCLDCKSFMVGKAREWMLAQQFDFIVTGEVIGQRPKSQRRATMPIIAVESGAGERLVRPLCAKLLPPTLPEQEGWIDREQLFNFNGRSRKPQMALAAQYGFEQYSQPAGGCCFLTNPHYSVKLKDLWRSRGARDYELDDIMLLKVGRHLRPAPNFKVIVAREEGENQYLRGYRHDFPFLRPVSHLGPVALVDGEPTPNDIWLAARLVARFGQGRTAATVAIEVTDPEHGTQCIDVSPLPSDEVPKSWYI